VLCLAACGDPGEGPRVDGDASPQPVPSSDAGLPVDGGEPSEPEASTADTDAAVDAPTDSSAEAGPHGTTGYTGFDVGMNEWTAEFAPFQAFRMASGTRASEPRYCHLYTYWNITQSDPPGGDQTHTLSGLIQWMGTAESQCDEVLITFQGKQSAAESAPTTAQFETAFVAFLRLADAGQPLAAWNGKLSFTPWNEPNNQNPSGSGLTSPITPEQAAQYYLVAREHCAPAAGCRVAAGDFATNGATASDIEWNCADDNDPANTETHCANPSSENTTGAAPSYLDRYKNFIANSATQFALPASFRPEVLAYHPWQDVNDYIQSSQACSTYQNCVTRRLLQSLGGTWGGVELWDDEIGVGLQTSPAPSETTTQPCGAAFLVQLTNLSPRFTRVYFMTFAGGNGPLFDGATLRPAGVVLAARATSYGGAKCAPTGM
jgi:hypothetical protein